MKKDFIKFVTSNKYEMALYLEREVRKSGEKALDNFLLEILINETPVKKDSKE